MERYIVAVFAIFGALIFFGLTGTFIGHELKLNQTSCGGYCAAFGVVLMAYWGVPGFKLQFSVGVFILGAVIAWFMLKDEYIPILGSEGPGVRNFWPFIATCSGGLTCLLICFFPFQKIRVA